MAGRSYPIWNKVQACIYKSSKDWGAREESNVTVCVGTSASNSHEFVNHRTTRRELDNGDCEFRFYVDGVCIKRAVVTKKEKEMKQLDAIIKAADKKEIEQ
tara:strand:- start:833 stop:1135 length:303 start_codon:yes stop_codon:yes gene_type:complete